MGDSDSQHKGYHVEDGVSEVTSCFKEDSDKRDRATSYFDEELVSVNGLYNLYQFLHPNG